MRNLVRIIVFTALVGATAMAQAGTVIVPGNYRADLAYDDLSDDFTNIGRACVYILGAPSGMELTFEIQLEFDGGAIYDFDCTLLTKGNANSGKASRMKEDASKVALCSGELNGGGNPVAFLFMPSGKGAKAKLKKGQLVALGFNTTFADFVQNTTACPMPTP